MNGRRRTNRLLLGCSGTLLVGCLIFAIAGVLLIRSYNAAAARFEYRHWDETPGQVAGMGDVVAVTSGEKHVLALGADGSVWAWGNNTFGQLGSEAGRYCGMALIKSMSCSRTPLRVVGLPAIRAIAAGASHSLALDTEGRVWAWGSNGYGELGDGTTSVNDRDTPTLVPGLTGIAAIAAGGSRTLALGADGTVWQWGADLAGVGSCALRDGYHRRACNPSPVRVAGLAGATAIATSDDHSLALLADQTVWSWGSNVAGQLGDGSTTDRPAPGRVGALTGITSIAAGGFHSVATGPGGTLYAWGSNSLGQLGTGSRDTCDRAPCSLTPLELSLDADIQAVAADGDRTVFLKRGGDILLLGRRAVVSASDATCKLTPPITTTYQCLAEPSVIAQVGGATAVAVAGGNGQFFALVRDPSGRGMVWSWGYNYEGQLGRT